jgi:hypothetical protein
MKRFFPGTMIMTFVCRLALGQVAEVSDKFEIADVHVSPKSTSGGGPMGMNNQFARTGPVRGGRYEVKTASMVDLIRIAYGYASALARNVPPMLLRSDPVSLVGRPRNQFSEGFS